MKFELNNNLKKIENSYLRFSLFNSRLRLKSKYNISSKIHVFRAKCFDKDN